MASILVTGASGELGRLVVEDLLNRLKVPGSSIAVAVRDANKLPENIRNSGVSVRVADYGEPETWQSALSGIDRVLLISSNRVSSRVEQHKTVIDAAKTASVKLLAYTSILKADSNPMQLAAEHKETEQLIKESGVPYVFLRNGWYTENLLGGAAAWKEHKVIPSAAGDAKISGAARTDYASAAATVLSPSYKETNRVYELAGDTAFTMGDLASEASKALGVNIKHNSLPAAEYVKVLESFGLPGPLAGILADSDAKAQSDRALYDDSHGLSKLIGRPTVTLAASVEAALRSI